MPRIADDASRTTRVDARPKAGVHDRLTFIDVEDRNVPRTLCGLMPKGTRRREHEEQAIESLLIGQNLGHRGYRPS